MNDQAVLGGSDNKESACNAGDSSSIPGSEQSSGGGYGKPLQYSCWEITWTEDPGGLQSLGSQRDTTERLTFSLSFPYMMATRLF